MLSPRRWIVLPFLVFFPRASQIRINNLLFWLTFICIYVAGPFISHRSRIRNQGLCYLFLIALMYEFSRQTLIYFDINHFLL